MNSTFKFCVILIILSLLAFYLHTRTIAEGFEVISIHNNKTYQKPVSGILKVTGKTGETTVIWDNAGGIRISESCCPNKTCVNMGRTISSAIICIPNGIMVKPKFADYDAITQ